MGSLPRSIGAVLAGAAVAMLVILGIEFLSGVIFPPAAGLDPRNPDDIRRIVADAPLAARLLVLVAWMAGTFLGGLVAAKIARRAPGVHAGIITLLVLTGVIINGIQFAHPLWFTIVGMVVVLGAGIAAARAATPGITTATT